MVIDTASVRLALKTKSDEELWSLFLTHGEESFANEFWSEVRARQAAGTLDKASPFWSTGTLLRNRPTQVFKPEGKLIERTPEEWFARHRRLLSRLFRQRNRPA